MNPVRLIATQTNNRPGGCPHPDDPVVEVT